MHIKKEHETKNIFLSLVTFYEFGHKLYVNKFIIMERNTLTGKRLSAVHRNLLTYYNYKAEDDDIKANIDIPHLQKSYRELIGNPEKETELIATLAAVSYYMSSDSLGITPSIYQMFDGMIRPDLLKLYIMLYDTSTENRWISIRTVNGTIRLRNYCNWFLDDMIKTYLKNNLPDIKSISQAKEELEKSKRHKGRIPNDPRISHLLWGTYRLFQDTCTFKSPMPNKLCQFLLVYLQMLEVIPINPEIDTFWIRAQLRYIRTKKEKGSK